MQSGGSLNCMLETFAQKLISWMFGSLGREYEMLGYAIYETYVWEENGFCPILCSLAVISPKVRSCILIFLTQCSHVFLLSEQMTLLPPSVRLYFPDFGFIEITRIKA